jgi:hypothetical protein
VSYKWYLRSQLALKLYVRKDVSICDTHLGVKYLAVVSLMSNGRSTVCCCDFDCFAVVALLLVVLIRRICCAVPLPNVDDVAVLSITPLSKSCTAAASNCFGSNMIQCTLQEISTRLSSYQSLSTLDKYACVPYLNYLCSTACITVD